MRSAKFRGVILGGHKEDAVEVPFDPAARWSIAPRPLRPGRRGFAVDASLDGVAFASAIVSRSRRFWLLVPPAVEQAAQVTRGDAVTITLSPAAT